MSEQPVFKPSSRSAILMLLVFSGFVVVGGIALVIFMEMPILLLAGILALDAFLLWLGYTLNVDTELVFEPDGLVYRKGTVRLFAPWQQMEKLETRVHGRGYEQGIVLREKITAEALSFPSTILPRQRTDFMILSYIVTVPVKDGDIDLIALRETGFGAQLAKFAPHLFSGKS